MDSIFKNVIKKCGIDINLVESTKTTESNGGAGINAGFAKANLGAKRTSTEKHSPADKNLTVNSQPIAESPRLQAVSIAMQQIEKQFGKGSIMKMGDSLKNMATMPVFPYSPPGAQTSNVGVLPTIVTIEN